MITAPFLDDEGNLMLLLPAHLDLPSRPHRVRKYGGMFVWVLLREIQKGTIDDELFFELHRRAMHRWLTKKKVYDWDRGGDLDAGARQNENARIMVLYDKKWGIWNGGGPTKMRET